MTLCLLSTFTACDLMTARDMSDFAKNLALKEETSSGATKMY